MNNNDYYKKRVTVALDRYKESAFDCSAGYDILRYASQGLLQVDNSTDPNVFVQNYPQHAGYILLQLAKQGKLLYKQRSVC
jgi:hypothetical protein